MVEERLTDGRRIAQLLASELTGEGDDLAVTDADPDVAPTVDGALAYRVVRDADDVEADSDADADDVEADSDADATPVAEVFVHPDRARVEFLVAVDAAAEAAADAGLRVRPKATRPPRTVVFVEDGAQVKWALSAFAAAAGATA